MSGSESDESNRITTVDLLLRTRPSPTIMEQYPLEARFKAAAAWLTSTPAAASLPNNTKLEVGGMA